MIPVQGFGSPEDLKVAFNFSIKSSEAITANWKVKVINSGETKYYTIHTTEVESTEWEDIFSYLTLPTFILGSEEVQLYLEVTPAEADLSLDNVSMGSEDEGDWIEEANKRIDTLRKKNVDIKFNSTQSILKIFKLKLSKRITNFRLVQQRRVKE